ncbi:hypothetical protein APHAL10511_000071 [Amanita phalloides]|nr:hypothetical protein APHAL10511_000071 [Amanita phalloides]
MADSVLFTCLSCSIAFHSAQEQRLHYRSDHHRYNMKRRVATLPPVSASVFNEKVMERRQETAVVISPKDFACPGCNKVYTTENTYKSHLSSKKHRENESKTNNGHAGTRINDTPKSQKVHQTPAPISVSPEAEMAQAIDQKIAAARTKLSTLDCLFCPSTSTSLDENLSHMSLSHSFFIPDAEYLVDLPGLLTYLGEKVAVGNVCIYCSTKSRDFRSLDAVRKHMTDKTHCKIAYDSQDDRLEVADFYDFTSSYPDAESRRSEDNEWEDVEDDDDHDVDVETESDEETIPKNQITFGDTEYELVLPSGARIGHRSMRRYYAQSFRFTPPSDPEMHHADSGVALVRRLLADRNTALVPRKGGFGSFGMGTAVVKARNAGEAREAGRHVREFRDQKRREEFKTRVAFKHNHQKHYRDPLLQ